MPVLLIVVSMVRAIIQKYNAKILIYVLYPNVIQSQAAILLLKSIVLKSWERQILA